MCCVCMGLFLHHWLAEAAARHVLVENLRILILLPLLVSCVRRWSARANNVEQELALSLCVSSLVSLEFVFVALPLSSTSLATHSSIDFWDGWSASIYHDRRELAGGVCESSGRKLCLVE